MTVTFASFGGDSIGAPSTSHQYGPLTISNINKLLKVETVYWVTAQGGTIGSGSTFVQDIIWGTQFGPTGYAPPALPAGLNSETFFYAQLAGGNTFGGFGWTPPTNTAEWMPYGGQQKVWRGQLYVGESVDFYVNSGSLAGGFGSWEDVLMLTIVYDSS